MVINKEIDLGNKVKVTYTVIYSIEVIMKECINITLHSFTSEDYYKKALQKEKLQKEQLELANQLYNELDEEKSHKIHLKINELASKINNLNNYGDYIVGIKDIKIPFIEDYNEDYLKEEILLRL